MNVIAYDPFPPDQERLDELGVTMVKSLDDVLEKSDFVSIHCPRHAGKTAISSMQRGCRR